MNTLNIKSTWSKWLQKVRSKKDVEGDILKTSEANKTSQETLTVVTPGSTITLYGKGSAPIVPLKHVNTTCLASQRLLEETLAKPGVPPTIVLPPSGYWVDGVNDSPLEEVEPEATAQLITTPQSSSQYEIDIDKSAKDYRNFFIGKEHINLISYDEKLGPVLMSLKHEDIDGQAHVRMMLRLTKKTWHGVAATSISGTVTSLEKMANMLNSEVKLENFTAVMCLDASARIAAYDEHVLVNRFKFGVLYQRYGQTTEGDLFGNNDISPAFNEFLEMLGQKIQLQGHQGYQGGLDVKNDLTGTQAVYEQHYGREIMFHVAPLLPHSAGDAQQVQRKRHVGNDIVTIIFQEKETPFTPDMIVSHFLHAFIVITHLETADGETRYKVAVTARDDVPFFGPALLKPSIYRKGQEFKEFLLTKLINAENACYKAEKFAKLTSRTRISLLQNLVHDLESKTVELLGSGVRLDQGSVLIKPDENRKQEEPGARFTDTVKKVLISKNRLLSNNPVSDTENISKQMEREQQVESTMISSGTRFIYSVIANISRTLYYYIFIVLLSYILIFYNLQIYNIN